LWLQFLRATGSLWALALVLAVAVGVLGNFIRTLWTPVSSLTFFLAETFLKPFVSGVVADPAAKLLGTPNFQVTIAPQCSGLEGIGLILAFSACWLWLFRRECRFPHALILVPAGVATIFLLNAARIATLILIGNAGAPRIAAGGFHSQAGWIAFNAVAFGFCVAATHVPWIRSAEDAKPVAAAQPSENPSLPYLLPFVTILAVGMLTTAASSDFEWLYPIRFLAAAAVLWTLRKRYLTLNWRFSWFGPSIGIVAFALWIAFDALAKTASADPMPAALASSPSSIRVGWIVFRVLAAVVTVPIAEELAFRGFLLRRIAAPDFEALPLTTFTWLGLAVSSLAFGLLHGHFWFVGTLAGLLYAWAMLRRGHIGEAVIAHATTNAFLVCYVLLFHKWHLLS
jgi:exosortase E/protease (VPEID-CTERM system)